MIEIEAPDGSIVEFPDGTSDDVIVQAMQQNFGPDQGVNRTQKADIAQGFTGTPAPAQADQGADRVVNQPADIPIAQRLAAGVNREFEAISQGVSPTVPFIEDDGTQKFPPVGVVLNRPDGAFLVESQTGKAVPLSEVEDDVVVFTMDDGMRLAFPRDESTRAGFLERFGRLVGLGAAAGSPSRFASKTAQNAATTQRIAQSQEFAIPLSKGQQTQSRAQLAFEEEARQAVRGAPAEREAARFFGSDVESGVQPQAIDRAVDTLATEVGGGQRTVAFARDAAESALEAVRAETQKLKQAAQTRFQEVTRAGKSDPLVFSKDFVANARLRAAQALEDADFRFNATLQRGTAEAMDALNDLAKARPQGEGIPFQMIDKVRRELVKIKAVDPADGEMLRVVRGAYTDFIDDAANTALISGNVDVAQRNKEAINFWRQFRQITDSAVGNESDAVIRKLVSEKFDATVDQTVNWLFGATKVGMTPTAVKTTKRLKQILGAEHQAILDLRQGAFLKAVSVPLGKARKGPQAMANSLNDFLNSDLAKELYKGAEIAKMRRFVGVLRDLVPPTNVTNPSRSGFKGAELLRQATAQVAGLIGLAAGGLEGAILGRFGLPTGADALNVLRVRSATSPQKLSNLIDAARGTPTVKIGAPAAVVLPKATATQDQLTRTSPP